MRWSRRAATPDTPAARRVVFLTWRDTGHPDGGGSEVYVERVGEGLAAAGWDVTIACAAYPGAPADEVKAGVRYRRRGGRLGVYLRGALYLLGTARTADVVVDVHNGLPFFSALVRRRPVVVLLHHVHREQWQMIYPDWRGRVGWWIESSLSPRLYRRHRYVTVSYASRSEMAEIGIDPQRVEVIHNGIEVPHPTTTRPRDPKPTVCVLGRLVPHKQVEHAFAAAAAIRARLPELRVEVIGDGWWRDILQQRAVEYGVADLVTFHGHVTDAERGRLLDRSWVMLAPSVKEGWGIAIMEAAARGVPAVAYLSGGGVTESIEDGRTGRLVVDLDELIAVTAELLVDRDLRERTGRAARDRAAAYDWGSATVAFEKVLGDAVG